MAHITIRPSGLLPTCDGDVNLYISEEAKAHQWFEHHRRVIFVNGMQNKPDAHKLSAEGLSLMQNCPVIGVYNLSEGFWADLGQAIRDKFQNAKREVNKAVKNQKEEELDKMKIAEEVLSRNPAAASLFKLLMSPEFSRVPIFAHSQGNFITSNALSAVAAVAGDAGVLGREVHSYGSPCASWPKGIIHYNFAFTFDPVTWLSIGDLGWLTFDNIKIGGVLAHGFEQYMKYDPEFIINRFRWGGWGVTLSLNEKGLAKALVDMGGNATRIMKIIERLDKAHNSDVDDVVTHYLRIVRRDTSRVDTLRMMKRNQPDLIKLMIKALDEGWTTKEEYDHIDFLKKL